MMALVWRPGALLLARSPHYAKGMYSALAGFVEAGETLEQCADVFGVTVDVERDGAGGCFIRYRRPEPRPLRLKLVAGEGT